MLSTTSRQDEALLFLTLTAVARWPCTQAAGGHQLRLMPRPPSPPNLNTGVARALPRARQGLPAPAAPGAQRFHAGEAPSWFACVACWLPSCAPGPPRLLLPHHALPLNWRPGLLTAPAPGWLHADLACQRARRASYVCPAGHPVRWGAGWLAAGMPCGGGLHAKIAFLPPPRLGSPVPSCAALPLLLRPSPGPPPPGGAPWDLQFTGHSLGEQAHRRARAFCASFAIRHGGGGCTLTVPTVLPGPAPAGGALACLAAYEAVQLCRDLGLPARVQCYTFGCPRPGNHCERCWGRRGARRPLPCWWPLPSPASAAGAHPDPSPPRPTVLPNTAHVQRLRGST